MKGLRVGRIGRQFLLPRSSRPCCLRTRSSRSAVVMGRFQSSMAAAAPPSDIIYEDDLESEQRALPLRHESSPFPSPLPSAAPQSAKLAALHARLALPRRLPIETMARTLVDPSADADVRFNNSSLAQLGGSIISYHVSEFLICTYPRLPMAVLFAASYAYNGPRTLEIIAKEWGVETAAAPGSEVDPGLLQFEKLKPGAKVSNEGGSIRPDQKAYFRRGMTSRLVYDDEFGDTIPKHQDETAPLRTELAYAGFVKAVVGALHLHAGPEAAKTFVKQHILSRHLEISTLFQFKEPLRELSRLCARENFEYPVARIMSETGRHTRSPVFVVGIFAGQDKLGEAAAAGLQEARLRASVAALKAWYLYSPGRNVRVPSDMEVAPAARKKLPVWTPTYIDIGEIIH